MTESLVKAEDLSTRDRKLYLMFDICTKNVALAIYKVKSESKNKCRFASSFVLFVHVLLQYGCTNTATLEYTVDALMQAAVNAEMLRVLPYFNSTTDLDTNMALHMM